MLDKITSPAMLKHLSLEEKEQLAADIRLRLIDVVLKNGGHLASNLGVVELTMAVHRVFDTPKDHVIFDVGHQCYIHKILTGRANKFSTLRKTNGLSGFLSSEESKYDIFESGHSSTSIST